MKVILQVYKQQWDWETTHEIFVSSAPRMSDTDYRVWLAEREVHLDIDEHFDMRPAQIAALRVQREEVMADAQAKLNRIEEKIQKLLAIPHEPAKGSI